MMNRSSTSRGAAIATLAFAALALACSSREDRTERHSYSASIRTDLPTSSITIDGVHLTIDNAVRIETTLGDAIKGVAESAIEGQGAPSAGTITDLSRPAFTIAGQPLALRDGHLFLGATDYGEVAPGDDVTVDPDGVSVDGEPRGPLP